MRHVDWDVVKCLVIAGPGFTKDSFKAFLEVEAVRQDYRCTSPSPFHTTQDASGLCRPSPLTSQRLTACDLKLEASVCCVLAGAWPSVC